MAGFFGDISNSFSIPAGDSFRRKADDSGWESFTPSSYSLAVGNAISSGTNDRILFQSGGNIAQSANLTFNGTKLTTTELEVSAAFSLAKNGGESRMFATTGQQMLVSGSYVEGVAIFPIYGSSGSATFKNTSGYIQMILRTAGGGTIGTFGSDGTTNDFQISAASNQSVAVGSPLKLASMADSSAPNSTLYYSTTQSKIVWKDAGGTVNVLY